MTSIDILVVTYNSAEHIGPCLDSLLEEPALNVVIYDNNSWDETPHILDSYSSQVKLIRGARNLGFARAVNLASRDVTSDVIALLNPDAVVRPSGLRHLAEIALRPGVGIVGPNIRVAKNQGVISSAGALPTIWSMFCHLTGLSRTAVTFFSGHYLLRKRLGVQPRVVGWVTGACMVMRRDLWEELSGLDERWFMYAEDIDLCRRATLRGYQNILVPSVTCEHAVEGSRAMPASAADVNTLWLENLYDLYATKMAPSRFHTASWGVLVGAGYFARWGILRALSVFDSRSRQSAAAFAAYSRAALRAIPRMTSTSTKHGTGSGE